MADINQLVNRAEEFMVKAPYLPLGLAKEMITALKEQTPQWISVKDRLPVRPPDVCGLLVRRKWYLVALESGAVLTLSYEFDEDRWQGVGSPVTHWMPLPEPPLKDGDA